jgi:alkylated DNA repair dioxygenase AlkB
MNHPQIPGLTIITEVITPEDQLDLVKSITEKGVWNNSLKRRTQHYGYRYDYTAKNISPSDYLGPFPEWLNDLSSKMSGHLGFVPEQAIINEYTKGQQITPHIDAPYLFGPIVASLSLCSDSKMHFSNSYKSGTQIVVELPARSLVILSGESRSRWYHSILPVKEYRLSVTFRTVTIKND